MSQRVPQANSTGTGRRVAKREKGSKASKNPPLGGTGASLVTLISYSPHIPSDAKHFCDVFGGSAAILINRSPAPVETYNDLDSELVNFFKTLRDDGQALMRAIGLTPILQGGTCAGV